MRRISAARYYVMVVFALTLALSATAGAAKKPVVVTLALAAVPTNVDPAVVQGRSSLEALQGVMSPLVRYKPLAPGRTTLQSPSAVQGELAESWVRNADGSITFTLRKARSAAGRVLRPEDVKWTFEREIALDPIGRFVLNVGGVDLKNPVEVIDNRRVRVRVTQRNSLTLGVLLYYSLGILDSAEVQAHATPSDPWAKEWLSTHSASFGAYQVGSFTPGEELRLIRNPNYWNKGRVQTDRLVLRSVPDAGVRQLLVSSGQADFVPALTYDLFKSVRDSKSTKVKTVASIDTNVDTLSLNHRIKPFSDVRVRRAIAIAIDRDALVRGAYAGLGKPSVYMLSSRIPQPVPPASQAIKTNLAQARQLLAAAGYPSGFSFKLTISPTRPGPWAEASATLLQSQLARIGINVEIQVIASGAEFQAAVAGRKLEAWLYAIRPVLADPGYLIRLTFSYTGLGYEGYSNQKVDRLSDLMLGTYPGNRRDRYIRSAMATLAEELPYIPLVETVIPWVFRSNLGGVVPNPTGTVYPQDLTKTG